MQPQHLPGAAGCSGSPWRARPPLVAACLGVRPGCCGGGSCAVLQKQQLQQKQQQQQKQHHLQLAWSLLQGRRQAALLLFGRAVHLRQAAREEVERIVSQLRERWPKTRIILRADSGFCREDLMRWCEENAVEAI